MLKSRKIKASKQEAHLIGNCYLREVDECSVAPERKHIFNKLYKEKNALKKQTI